MAYIEYSNFTDVTLTSNSYNWSGGMTGSGSKSFSPEDSGAYVEVTGKPVINSIPESAIILFANVHVIAAGSATGEGGFGLIEFPSNGSFDPNLFGDDSAPLPQTEAIGLGGGLIDATNFETLAESVLGYRATGGTGESYGGSVDLNLSYYRLRVYYFSAIETRSGVTTPAHGPESGGTSFSITGEGLDYSIATVYIDGIPLEPENVIVFSANTLLCISPPSESGPGYKDVVVEIQSKIATIVNGFLYDLPIEWYYDPETGLYQRSAVDPCA